MPVDSANIERSAAETTKADTDAEAVRLLRQKTEIVEQQAAAEASLAEEQKKYKAPIATEVAAAAVYWPAEAGCQNRFLISILYYFIPSYNMSLHFIVSL